MLSMTMKIDIVLYSYKGKNLPLVVETLIKNTNNDLMIYLYDQTPIDRTDKLDIPKVDYVHIFWDHQHSPCYYKKEGIGKGSGDFILVVSDDILVSPGWDDKLINFITSKDEPVVISGMGKLELKQKDLFSISEEYADSDKFTYTGWVDRNFIFAKRSVWEKIGYPDHIKYAGENEDLTMTIWELDYSICSVPSGLYSDLKVRTIESLYTPYSIEHNYNIVLNRMKRPSAAKMCHFHGISPKKLYPLPYETNDVAYDPTDLKFNEVDARKFVAITKAIY